MTIIELVIGIAVLIATAAFVNSRASIPAGTKQIVNIGVSVILAILILIFVLSLSGVGLHRRI